MDSSLSYKECDLPFISLETGIFMPVIRDKKAYIYLNLVILTVKGEIFMKISTLFFALLFSLFLLQGCNNAPVEQDDDHVTNSETNNKNKKTENVFNFTSFDLDVDYTNNKSYEADYDNDPNGVEATIQDEIANKTLKGDEAFQQLSPIFEQLKFDKTTPNEEVISEVLKVFNLNNNFTKFDLDVEFQDGTEKEYQTAK